MARLVYMDPEGRQQTLDLDAQTPQIVIGRHPDCDLVSDDTSVSRRHCIISFEGGHYRISDLGSANGTQVNDVRVTRKNLSTRDIVRCGNLLLQFFDEPEVLTAPPMAMPPPPPPPPPVAQKSGFSQGSMMDTSVGTSINTLMRAEIGRLQERIKSLESSNAGQAERLADLQQELALAGSRIDAALGHATEAESEARDLRAQLWHAEEDLRARSVALEARELELHELQERAHREALPVVGEGLGGPVPVENVLETDERSELMDALADARGRLVVVEAEFAAAQVRLEHLEGAASEAEKARVDLESLRQRLKEATTELNARRAAHRAEIDALKERLQIADDAATLARTEADAALRSVNERLGEAERRLARVDAEWTAERAAHQDTRSEADALRARITEFERALASAREAAAGWNAERATLTAAAAVATTRAETLAEARAALEEMNGRLVTERDAARIALETAKGADAELSTRLQALTHQLDLRDEALAEVAAQLTARDTALEGLRTQFMESEAARTALQAEARAQPDVAALQARLDAAEAALAKMRGDRLTATSARAAEMAMVRARLAQAEADLEAARAETAATAAQLVEARNEAEAQRVMAVAASRRQADDPAEMRHLRGPASAEIEPLKSRISELEAALAGAEEREAEREAHLALLTSGRTRAERALQEREATVAALEAEKAVLGTTCDVVTTELGTARAALEASTQALDELRRDEARLRSALAEARDEAKTAGQVRRALRDAQAEAERLKTALLDAQAATAAAPTVDVGALESALAAAQAEALSARERLASMETRIRQTEIALAEAEGRAQEAQTALIQVREAERAARDGHHADRNTADRMNQMNVKLAAVTRRAQLAEEQAAAARRLEERATSLEAELEAVRIQFAEAEAERDTASATTLALLAEKRGMSDELQRLRDKLAAAPAAAPSWPNWMDDHLEMLGELIIQFRADMSQLARWSASLPPAGELDASREGADFKSALENAQAGADSLAEATTAAREAMDTLRRDLGAGPRVDG
jgi:chromosome segregation ATPase